MRLLYGYTLLPGNIERSNGSTGIIELRYYLMRLKHNYAAAYMHGRRIELKLNEWWDFFVLTVIRYDGF